MWYLFGVLFVKLRCDRSVRGNGGLRACSVRPGPHAILNTLSTVRRGPFTQASFIAFYAPIAFASTLTLEFVTVVHFTLPVARLFFEIESQARWASDLFKT